MKMETYLIKSPLPPVVLEVIVSICILIASATAATQYRRLSRKFDDLRQRHVFITGGSKGLGKELAKELVLTHGASVTIVARSTKEIAETTEEIRAGLGALPEHLATGRIQGFSCDVTDFNLVSETLEKSERAFGAVHWLVNAAGAARTGKFLSCTPEDFESQIKLNYLGSLYPTRITLEKMVKAIKREASHNNNEPPTNRFSPPRRIIFVSSQAGLMSCVGYSAYSPSKFAVRGLVEALRNEFCYLSERLAFHVIYPGNMKTPGFEAEQETKPPETKEIEASEPLQDAKGVAVASLDSIRKGDFAVYGGNVSGFFLGRMSMGLAPRSTVLLDLIVAPILVLVGWLNRAYVLDRIVKREANRKSGNKLL